MAHYCPVTGVKITSNPEWVNQKTGENFVSNFWIINDSIIYSLPTGIPDLRALRRSLSLNYKVAEHLTDSQGPYIQIEDLFFLKNASSAVRRYFTDEINNNKRRLIMIFCNLSLPLSIAVKMGQRFNTTRKNILVARQYRDAIEKALTLEGEADGMAPRAPIDLRHYRSDTKPYLTPVEIVTEGIEDIKTPDFTNRSIVIDQSIIHSTSEGYLESEHVELTDAVRSQCREVIAEDATIEYIIVNCSNLKGGSRSGRIKYMQTLKNWHQRFPFKMYIVYGANTFMKTALHLARTVMPFKLRIARDIQHAFQLIRKDRSSSLSNCQASVDLGKSAIGQNGDIGKVMALIGSINWEKRGIDNSYDIGEESPYFYLYQSIKLIKEELDALFVEREQLEKQLYQSRKMESLGTLASGIAHNFNNILHMIIGSAELALLDIPQSSPAYANLEMSVASALRAAEIIKQLISFSYPTRQEFKSLNAIDLIRDALQLLRFTIPANVEIRDAILPGSAIVQGDPAQINQALMNIFANASDAMQESGGILEIQVEETTIEEHYKRQGCTGNYGDLSPGKYIKITVKDTGSGMESEHFDRIFEPYFTTKDFSKGQGMGLSIAYGIVKNHGGAISVESQPGIGSTFCMFFPVRAEHAFFDGNISREIPTGNETILFVDDESSIASFTHQMLEGLGYKVESHTCPVEALESFQTNPDRFDLVITDMTMPKLTGVNLSKILLGIRPEIPIIICTGYNPLIDEERAKDLGIAAYIEKPIEMRSMAEAIRKVLGSRLAKQT